MHGESIVHMLKPAASAAKKNFAEYAPEVFIPLRFSSLSKHGKGVHRHVVAEGVIQGNWLDFLHVDRDKTKLFNIYSKALLEEFNQEGKQLVVITDGESIKASLCCMILIHSPHATMKRLITACRAGRYTYI